MSAYSRFLRPLFGTQGLLSVRYRARALLTGVTLAGNLVDGIRSAAFAVLAAQFSSSATQVGLVATMAALPGAVLGMPAGVLLDRWDKLRVMAVVTVARTVLYAGLALALSVGIRSIPFLCFFALALGAIEFLYDSAAYLAVPDIAEEEDFFSTHVVLHWVTELGNGALGPMLGVALVATASASPFALAAALLLASSVGLRALRRGVAPRESAVALELASVDEPGQPDEPAVARLRAQVIDFWAELREGLSYCLRHPLARSLLLVFGAWSLFGWMPEAVLVLYARDVVNGGNTAFAQFLTMTSLGSLIGGAMAFLVPRKTSLRLLTAASLLAYGLTLAIPGVWPSILLMSIMSFAQGLPLMVLNSTVAAQMQMSIPRHLQGRVDAVMDVTYSLTMAVGLFLGGVLAEHISTQAVFVLGGVGVALAGVVAWLTFERKSADT